MKVYKGVKITHSRPLHYMQVSHQLYAPLNRRPDGHQRQYGYFNDEKRFLPAPEIEPQFLVRPVRSQVTIRFCYCSSNMGNMWFQKLYRPTATNSKYLNFERSFLESTSIFKGTLNENRQHFSGLSSYNVLN
jgi:hypothetical protein